MTSKEIKCMGSDKRPDPNPGGISRNQHRFLSCLLRILTRPLWQLNIHGLDNVPLDGAFILLPKHQRWEDIPLLGMAAPRRLHYVAKRELFGNPVGDAVLRFFGGLPLDRTRPLKSRATLVRTAQLLNQGRGVAVFPEGTYYPHQMGPGHKGIVRFLLRRTRVPFLPVGICYPKHRNGGPLTAHVRFGQPIAMDGKRSYDEFLQVVMNRIKALSGIQ
jgi:1-acyl-sn-glycerol-3-phosphate acyltransferase